ncbi:MAG: hypothetical protein AAFV29_15425, partial [Myxococcota bacterium]
VEVTIMHDYSLRVTTDTFTLVAEVRHQVAWSFIANSGRGQLKGIGLRFVTPVSPVDEVPPRAAELLH